MDERREGRIKGKILKSGKKSEVRKRKEKGGK